MHPTSYCCNPYEMVHAKFSFANPITDTETSITADTQKYHNPCLSTTATANPPEGLKIEDWDGAAEMIFGPRDFTPPAKSQDYYEKVILVDERRFLMSEALKHLLRVDNGTIEGDVNVVIKDGKPLIEYDEYKKIWDEWVVEEKK
jgi:hypothetical protein